MKKQPMDNKVRDWWNTNPYSYGLSKKDGYRDVGNVDDAQLDLAFFERYMKKVRKHFDDAQSLDQPLTARFLDYNALKGKKVLDVAIGSGWSTVELIRAGALVTGIDITQRSIEITRKHLMLRGLDADLQVMDAQKMDFPDETFGYVHAWGCLMHMPDTEGAIKEIFRVLKSGGKTSGYMYNKNSITFWWHKWFLRGILQGKLLAYKGDIQKLISRYSDGVTIGGTPLAKVYTPKQVVKMFNDAGFIKVTVKPWGPPEMISNFPIRKLRLGKFLSYRWRKKIAARWGWGMIFHATRPMKD